MGPWFVSSQEWLLRSSLAGGALLLLGVLLMLATRQPARRQRVGEAALVCSLLVALLCAFPAWTPWNIPVWEPVAQPADAPSDGEPIREILVIEQPYQLVAMTPGQEALLPRGERADIALLDLHPAGVATHAERIDPASNEESASASASEDGFCSSLAEIWLAAAPWVIGVYTLGVLFLLLRCLLGCIGLRRLWQRSEPVPAHVRALLEELAAGLSRSPRLGVSTRISLPVSFGLFRPTILIPWSFCRPNKNEDLRQVLVHELTHLKRLDAWSCMLVAFGQLVWFHLPHFWWLRKQVRLCQEYVADAAAAALSSTEDYAEYLVSLSGYAAPRLPVGARVMGMKGTTSDLFRRVAMLLNGSREVENRPPRWWSALVGGAFVAVAVLVSGIGLRATALADDGKNEASKEVIIRAHAITDDGDKTEKKVIWLQADGKDAKSFRVVEPKDGKGSLIAFPADKGEKHFFAVTVDGGKEAKTYWVQPDAKDKQRFVVTPSGGKDPTHMYWLVDDDRKVGVTARKEMKQPYVFIADEKGSEKKAVVGEKSVDGRRVEVKDLGDGRRAIIIIEERVTDDKKGAGKAGGDIKFDGGKRVFERAILVDPDGKPKSRAEALRKAVEALKGLEGKGDLDGARKAIEDAMRQLEKLEASDPSKQKAEENIRNVIEKRQLELRDKQWHLPKLLADQVEKAATEYKKATDAVSKARQLGDEKAKEAAAAADKKAVEAHKKAVEYLRLKDRKEKPSGVRLGVAVSEPSATLVDQLELGKDRGLVIDQVAEDSPAAKAGLLANDVLVEFNGKSVSSSVEDFVKTVQALKPGTKINATVLRKGKKKEIQGIVLAEATASDEKDLLEKLKKDFKIDLKELTEGDFDKITKELELKLRDVEKGKGLDLERVQPAFEKFARLEFSNVRPSVRAFSRLADGKERNVTVTCERNNDEFTVKVKEDKLSITMTGTVKDEKANVKSIVINAGGKETKYESAAKAPEEHQKRLKKLLELVEKGTVEFDPED
jgi:beta-lactamase regulating signal transducer with metallopeptidase domain/type II secretory pathway component PulC